MRRRAFLVAMTGSLALPYLLSARATGVDAEKLAEIRTNWQQLLPENADIAATLDPIERSESEWRKLLDSKAYRVLFEEDTEPAFSSPLDKEKRAGVFICAACRLPLFTSEMKYDSGTGWPSFFTHIPDRLGTKTDFRLIWPRTEYHCIKCGGHQGHVFDDGPPPTGERWCNNGLALEFIAAS